ncbi:MAG: glutamyl-tRNA reductase [Sulfurimonas sp.]|nr:glutamyl-tRNA reductase [Sulfurimonas sp.]
MHYLTVSFTHKNSTFEIREQLSYPDDEVKKRCLKNLTQIDAINEVILLSTCNRMEIICSCNDLIEATKHIFEILSQHSGIAVKDLKDRADVFDDSSAIHHVFSVASSLDSMVVGETQIVGQMKDAFKFSIENEFCSKKLARAMHTAFKCAAKVRNATDISSKPVSIASVAVSKLKSVLTDLKGKKALVIGVGEMSEISAKHLVTSGADVYIMNRTKTKAEILARECNTKILDYGKLSEAVNQFPIIFTATGAQNFIINDDVIEPCDFDRYWFDMALPRDIEHCLDEKIHLYQIDDLKSIVAENIGLREESARKAHGIIGRSTVDFFEWLDTLNVEPMIKEIYEKAFNAAKEESNRVMKNGYIPKEYESQVNKMAQQVLKRFLHNMTVQMRDKSDETKSDLGPMQYLVDEGKMKNKIKGRP